MESHSWILGKFTPRGKEINEVESNALPPRPTGSAWLRRPGLNRGAPSLYKPFIRSNLAVRACAPVSEGWKATVIDGVIELFPGAVTRGAITPN